MYYIECKGLGAPVRSYVIACHLFFFVFISEYSHGLTGPYSCPYENGYSDQMFPLSDGQRLARIKQCLPPDIEGNLTGVAESLSQQYHKNANHTQSGQISDDLIKTIPLEYSFLPMAPSGFIKRSVPNYAGTSPALERVCPILGDDYNDKSKRFTAAGLNIFQCNAACSEVNE